MCFFKEKGCHFEAPGIGSFHLKGVFSSNSLSRIDLIALLLSSLIFFVVVRFAIYLKRREGRIVVAKKDILLELFYEWVRDQIARSFLGTVEYLPLFSTFFVLIAIFNLTGITPLVNFPINSLIGYPLAFALIAMAFFFVDGFRHSGKKFFRVLAVPPNVPAFILPLLIPMEIISNVVIRPFTLTIRLFVNMVAGHLLLLMVEYSAFFFLKHMFPLTIFLIVAEMILICFELFVSFLQAYIFSALVANYMSSVRDE
jgi:F-type H+-transporting ATPase subunit a